MIKSPFDGFKPGKDWSMALGRGFWATRDIRDVLAIANLARSSEDVEFVARRYRKYKRRNRQE
jgi:hypothetical protein